MSETGAGVDPQAFRDTMAGVATPVAIVTAFDDGRPHGTTVSAFASLSMSPPMILVALSRTSRLLEIVLAGQRFGVSVLAEDQADLAVAFACKGEDKFAGLEWSVRGDLPALPDAAGWLACRTTHTVDGGDHVVVLGTVVAAAPSPRPPLTYHARVFGTHTPSSTRPGEPRRGS